MNMGREVAIKLSKQELQSLVDHMLEYLHVWSENEVEDEDKEEFQRLLDVTSKLYEALGEEHYIII